ncbi:unnamed protein product [Cunninghamella blakesleeana]
MPKTVSLITGIIVASAIVYKINEDNKLETRQIQQKLSTPTDILENKLDRENISIHNALENSQHYFRQRLVPSVKASWNNHVTFLTHKLMTLIFLLKLNIIGIKTYLVYQNLKKTNM